MPRNCFAFAIGVSRENHAVRFFHTAGDLIDGLGLAAIDLPAHGKVLLGVHRTILGRKVAHMAHRSEDFVLATEIFVDGFRLGGRFHNDEVHERLSERQTGDLPGRGEKRAPPYLKSPGLTMGAHTGFPSRARALGRWRRLEHEYPTLTCQTACSFSPDRGSCSLT